MSTNKRFWIIGILFCSLLSLTCNGQTASPGSSDLSNPTEKGVAPEDGKVRKSDNGDKKRPVHEKNRRTEPKEKEEEEPSKEEMLKLLDEINQKLYGGKLFEKLADKCVGLEKAREMVFGKRLSFRTIWGPKRARGLLASRMQESYGNFPRALTGMYDFHWPNWRSIPAATGIIESGLGADRNAIQKYRSLWDGSRYR